MFLAAFLILLIDRIIIQWQKRGKADFDIQRMKNSVRLMLDQLSRYE
jgi:hypothetical protein